MGTLTIDEMVEYLNKGLSDGKKVADIRKELSLSEKSVQKRLKDSGYKFNQKLKQYIKTDADAVIQEEYKNSTTDVVLQSDYNMTTDISTNMPKEFFDAINRMNEMSNKFEHMYNWYEIQTKVVDVPVKPELKIDPNENITVTRSMRLYLDTYERFTAFTKANKDKRVQDILETALREFLDRYEGDR